MITATISMVPTQPSTETAHAQSQRVSPKIEQKVKSVAPQQLETTNVEAVQEPQEQEVVQDTTPAVEPAVDTPTVVSQQISGSHEDWMAQAGIAAGDYSAVDYIVSHESGWRYWVVNGEGSGATGLCQALPGSKMASAGDDWATNPVTQLKWCSSYAASRYGGWWGAYNAWVSQHWW